MHDYPHTSISKTLKEGQSLIGGSRSLAGRQQKQHPTRRLRKYSFAGYKFGTSTGIAYKTVWIYNQIKHREGSAAPKFFAEGKIPFSECGIRTGRNFPESHEKLLEEALHLSGIFQLLRDTFCQPLSYHL